MSKGSLNNWTAQTLLNVQPFRSFEKYNSMPKARSQDLKMHLFVSLVFIIIIFNFFFLFPQIALASYSEVLVPTLFMQEMMSIQLVIGGQKCFQEQVKLVWLQRQTVKQL